MKHLGMIFAALCLLMVLLITGCGTNPAQPHAPLEEPLPLAEFTFTSAGSSSDSIYSYTAEKTAQGTHIYLELNCGQHVVDVTVEEDVLGELGQIAAIYRLDLWDGFDKNNKDVMDGSTFSLYMTTADGQSISAHGSNAFPNGYGAAKAEIDALFEGLIWKYGDLWPKTVESDEMDSFSLSLKESSNKVFFVSAFQEQDRCGLDIRIDGYEEVFPEEYLFYGYCDVFPFEDLQAVVRKYDIPSWNGWDGTDAASGNEWFQLSIEYASGETISATGRLYPENYDSARMEFVEILSGFLIENRENFIPNGE